MPDEYLTIEQAAESLERSVSSMWRIIRAQKIETYRRPLDRKTYVKRVDIERLQTEFHPRQRDWGKEAA